jgi:hypothetical protein
MVDDLQREWDPASWADDVRWSEKYKTEPFFLFGKLIERMLGWVKDRIFELANGLADAVGVGVKYLWDAMWKAILDFNKTKGKEADEDIRNTLTVWGTNWDTFWNGVLGKQSKTTAAMTSDLASTTAKMEDIITVTIPIQSKKWSGYWDSVQLATTTAGNQLTGTVSSNFKMMSAEDLAYQNEIKGRSDTFWPGYTTSIEAVWNGIKDDWNTMWTDIRTSIDTWYADNLAPLVSIGRSIGQAIVDGMSAVLSGAGSIFNSLRDGFITWVDMNMYSMQLKAWSIGNEIVKALLSGLGPLGNLGWNILQQIIGMFGGAAQGGLAAAPWTGVVGEAGPEALIPLNSPATTKLLAAAMSKALQSTMQPIASPVSSMMRSGNTNSNTYNLYVNTTQPVLSTVQSFETLRAMYGTY